MGNITIFKNIYDKNPFYISVDTALQRIKNGSSRATVADIRSKIDKERQDELKRSLPSVCFSGEFKERKDELIVKHSGFIVLDFDEVENMDDSRSELCANEYTYACWVSPRNNGLKVLVRIADGKKHRAHFEALRELFPSADKSGVNESRVCYESYDPEIYINHKAKVFQKTKVVEYTALKDTITDDKKIFDNIVKWLSNKGDAFVTGERNHFIFKLASACCRFGLEQDICILLITKTFEVGTNKFSVKECEQTIRSAYRSNHQFFGSAQFDRETLVDTTTRKEIEITQEMMDANIKPKDVIFGEDVKQEVFDIFNNGFKAVKGIGVPQLDEIFKMKEGEITLLSGYGNYGKSTFFAWQLLMRALILGEKFALFSPEERSPEFYHNLTEIILGGDCTPSNPLRPSHDEFEYAYDFVGRHFFYVYPKDLAPTPQYIKERFLELIIKEQVKGVVVDPFNQLTNDYRSSGGRSDKYLETFLADCSRFAQQNNVYFAVVAHPTKAQKDSKGNYPCPDVFDIADGAMWNNKMDNILIYDRPNHQIDPSSDVCELHSKKIRRQRIVGKKGTISFNYNRRSRRYMFMGVDYMSQAIAESEFYKNTNKKFDPTPTPQEFTMPRGTTFDFDVTELTDDILNPDVPF